ncbi:3-phosphoshikimate 1-carboxyvinyltransferase [Pseudoalteromonas sp. APC 3358]|uniref:3-phosphoshikimate 1-carboxyvinyltransferase n=1 Tax=Pseudoalteromonas sp. APC 3358 TaxID=3035176 RepID=UPI0025B2B50B|nr:3-phosphoshikimate 1-carboxyvinyltransferase [Pseudoalteromonas sp. APC 3358]MDN3384675.1 3-phosphoshikimate 1-carboxyvinyltransferase [Pseudoalteromonas sp. APC 3358]
MSKLKADPAIRSLLNRMPSDVQDSFTEEQLVHLKVAIGARQWGQHAVDCRGVIKFFKYRYYFVLLAGRNRRELSKKEQKIAAISQAITISMFSFFVITILLLIIYLVKSALGIDIFSNYSFGIWAWFKELFK